MGAACSASNSIAMKSTSETNPPVSTSSHQGYARSNARPGDFGGVGRGSKGEGSPKMWDPSGGLPCRPPDVILIVYSQGVPHVSRRDRFAVSSQPSRCPSTSPTAAPEADELSPSRSNRIRHAFMHRAFAALRPPFRRVQEIRSSRSIRRGRDHCW